MNKYIDRYQQDIEYLKQNPDKIKKAWGNPHTKGGSIFGFLSLDRFGISSVFGCLTEIKYDSSCASTKELTKRIKNDNTIPAPKILL